MYILSSSPDTSHSDELTRVSFLGSTSLVTVFSRDPATVNNNSSSLDIYGVVSLELIFKRKLTSFVTIERVDDIKSVNSILLSRDENFFTHIKLSEDEVRLHSVIDIVFFNGHSPPSEVHLLPGSTVSNLSRESLVTLRALEFLSEEKTVLTVSERSSY